MGIVEKEGGFPVFGTDNLNIFFPTAEIIAWLTGKISTNLPAVEGLKRRQKITEKFSASQFTHCKLDQ